VPPEEVYFSIKAGRFYMKGRRGAVSRIFALPHLRFVVPHIKDPLGTIVPIRFILPKPKGVVFFKTVFWRYETVTGRELEIVPSEWQHIEAKVFYVAPDGTIREFDIEWKYGEPLDKDKLLERIYKGLIERYKEENALPPDVDPTEFAKKLIIRIEYYLAERHLY